MKRKASVKSRAQRRTNEPHLGWSLGHSFQKQIIESGVAGLNDLATPNIRSSTTRQISAAKVITYVIGRTDPGVPLGCRETSLRYQVANVINELTQLVAGDILLTIVYRRQRGIQLG